MQTTLENCMFQRKTWRGHNINACWTFYCVNDGKDVGRGSS